MTRKYAKRRETTWEYAKGVDGVNKSNHGRLGLAGPAVGAVDHESSQEGRSKVMPWTTSSGTFTVMRSTLGPMVLPSMSLRSVRCPPPPSAR